MEEMSFKFLTNFMNSFYKGKDGSKTVYFAGPCFTDEQKNVYLHFLSMVINIKGTRKLNYNVFFPYLFKGTPNDCFKADVMAIDASDILLAWLSHKDCGTSFEMGYAKAKGKKIIVLVDSIENLTNSKTNLMLAKSADGILFSIDWDKFLIGENAVHEMPEFNWEVLE